MLKTANHFVAHFVSIFLADNVLKENSFLLSQFLVLNPLVNGIT